MRDERFTVVIPTRNEEKFILQCLHSVRNDCGDRIPDIIVVDNGSTDRTHILASEFGAHVIDCSGTIACQRNAGARLAETDIIVFLDADCTVRKGWAEHALAWFAKADVVAAGAKPDPPDEASTWIQSTWCFIKRSMKDEPANVNWISSCNLWVCKSAFDKCNGFNEKFETCEDVDLGYRMSKHGRLVSDPQISVIHHREPATLRNFFNKEVWHGKNSYDGIANGRFRMHELPSLIAPLLFGMALILSLLSFLSVGLYDSSRLGLIALIIACLVPIIFSCRVHLGKGSWYRLPAVLTLYFFYFLARFTAFLKWMVRK